MVVFSDNDAMQLLINLLGEGNIRKTLSRMGVVETHLWEPDSVSVKEYGGFFRVLFNASLVDRDLSEKALSWLAEVDYGEGLVKHLPKNVKVAHKFGERDFGGAQQLHDCGIVYHPQRPYLLCVMTRGESREKLAPLIAEASRLVYEQFPGEIAQSAESRADVARAFDFSFGR
jgi:beta-lactamase class A